MTVARDAAAGGMDVAHVHVGVITPAMQEIGSLWARDALTVAEEHLATAISEEVLAELFPAALRRPPASRERVLLAGVQGEQHLLGMQMVADVLEGAGFDVLFAGADVPAGDLVALCREHRPAVVGLGASTPATVPALLDAAEDLWALDDPPRLMGGGAAVGALAGAGLDIAVVPSSDQAVAVVERLMREPAQGPPVTPRLRRRIPRETLGAGARTPGAEMAMPWTENVADAAEAVRAGRFLAAVTGTSTQEARAAAREAHRRRHES